MDRTPKADVLTALRAFVEDRSGVTAVEYALIAGMIALAIITAVTLVGSDLSNFFMKLDGNISSIG